MPKRKLYQLVNKSFDSEGVSSYKELWEKVKGDFDGLCMAMETVFTKSKKEDGSDEENRFDAIFSTASEDRHGDVVLQNWELGNFKKNPVLLDSHNYDSITNILGRIEKAGVKDGRLIGQLVFALNSPKGALAHSLVTDGFAYATSVGFIPKEFDDKGKILKSELLEVSLVSVPAQPQALIESKSLDGGEAPVEPEIEEQPKEPEAEPEAVPTPEPEPTPEVKQITRKSILLAIVRELDGTSTNNLQARKRSMYKSLRELLSRDK